MNQEDGFVSLNLPEIMDAAGDHIKSNGEIMKNLIVGLITLIFILFSCSTQKDKVTLQPGTESYNFAKELSSAIPALDPDSNKVIIDTEAFAISTGEVIELIVTNFGPSLGEFKKLPTDRIKRIIESNAEKLAEKKLILHAAKLKGITISDTQLDSILQTQYQQVGGEEVFLDYLAKQGVTIEFVRADLADGYVANKYMESVLLDESGISDQELEDNYRQLIQIDQTASVQHILLMTQGKTEQEKAEIYKNMKKILAKAKTGDDFGQLAATYSEDPGSKDKGGLYENFNRGTMVKPFEDAAFSVPVGELSDIIETQYGYHILKVVDRKKENRTFEEVKPEIQKKLLQEKQGSLTSAHIAKLKEESDYKKFSL